MLVTCALAGLVGTLPPPVRTAADVEDAYALVVNPAGLAFARAPELRLLAGRDVDGLSTDLGLFASLPLGALTIGAAGRWTGLGDGATRFEPSLGAGLDLRFGSLGFGWTGISSPGAADRGGDWSLGATARPVRWLSLATVVTDLAQRRGARGYELGLALRPFGERLTLATRWRFEHGRAFDADGGRPDLLTRLELEPLDGVVLGVSSDLHLRLGAQLALRFDGFGGGLVGRSTRDADGVADLAAELVLGGPRAPPLATTDKIAVIELAGALTPEPRFDLIAFDFTDPTYGAAPLLLDVIAEEPSFAGAFLKIGPLALGLARAEELMATIGRIRAAGKLVDCQLTGSDDVSYLVATACDTIVMPRPIPLIVDGLSARATYLGEALERLGVEPQVEAIGAYKTAPERFTRRGMSPAHREAVSALLDESFAVLVDGIARGRKLAPDEVRARIDVGVHTATAARAAGLIDEVLYPDELDRWLEKRHGAGVRYVGPAEVARVRRARWAGAPRIALIPVDAAIAAGESSSLPFGLGRTVGARSLVAALERARVDPGIVAVVLRVDSPGGDAVASDFVARAVDRLNRAKPVIASFGDVAASGGYYVAAPARAIYAQRSTITGSIGVYALGFSAGGLLARLGIGSESIARGRLADQGNPSRPATEAERAALRGGVQAAYSEFLRVVAEGRGLDPERVRAVAEGRVWTGADARRHRLIDELGGLHEAIARARFEAGLDPDTPAELVVLPAARGRWSRALREVFVDEAPNAAWPAWLQGLAGRVLAPAFGPGLDGGGTTIAALPFAIELR